jgi:Ni/Co efflux regulator RcnB
MLRIATCLVAASLVAGSIAPASAQTKETKPSRMQRLKEMKAKWSANRPKLKACKIEAKRKGLSGDDRWFYLSECMERH